MRALLLSVIRKNRRMRWRTVGISLILAWAMAMLVTGLWGGEVLESSVEAQVERTGMPDLFIEFSRPLEAGEVEDRLSPLEGVEAFDLRLRASGVYLHEGGSLPALLLGVSGADDDINRFEISSGRAFTSPGEAMAVSGMEERGLRTGEFAEFTVQGERVGVEVTGVGLNTEFITASAVTEMGLPIPGSMAVVLLPLQDLQAVVGEGVNDLVVLASDRGAVLSALEGLPVSSVVEREDHPSIQFLDAGVTEMKVVLPIISLVFLFIGAISIFMTVHRVVSNDSRLIGVMMALGYRPLQVAGAYLTLGLVIAAIGIALGTVLSYGFTVAVMTATMRMLADIELVYPFDPFPFMVGASYAVTATLAAMALPVARITRGNVREALEYRPSGRVYASRRLFARLSKLSAMGLRNALRNPLRAAFTILAVGITIGAAGSWVFLIDSSLDFTFEQLDADRWDVRVDLLSPIGAEDMRERLGLEEAGNVIPFISLTGRAFHGGGGMAATVIGCDRMEEARDIEVTEGELDLGGALISNALARELDLEVGDSVELAVGGERLSLPVTGIFLSISEGTIYTARGNLSPIFPAEDATGAFVGLPEGEVDEVAERLREMPSVSRVVVGSEVSESVEELISEFMSLYYTFFLLSAFIAFIVAASAVTVSAAEREVEYATLEVLGITRLGVSKAVLAEMSVLTLGSVAVGLPAAYLLSRYLAGVYQELIYYFPIYLNAFPLAVTAIIGGGFVMLAAIVPIRYASRLDSERVIRERTVG